MYTVITVILYTSFWRFFESCFSLFPRMRLRLSHFLILKQPCQAKQGLDKPEVSQVSFLAEFARKLALRCRSFSEAEVQPEPSGTEKPESKSLETGIIVLDDE